VVLNYDTVNYELESEVHYTILDRGYLVTSLSVFDFVVGFLDALFQGEVRGLP
jgi:hypothetical protein